MSVRRRATSRFQLRLVLAVAAVALFGDKAPTQSTPPSPYGILDLGLTAGPSVARDITDLGHGVVGGARTGAGVTHAFLFNERGARDLGTLGGPESEALAVYYGQVVGSAQNSAGQRRAFVYDTSQASMVDLGTLGGSWSIAHDVSATFIVGAAATAGDARVRAFQYANGTMSPVPIDRGGDSVARATNLANDIVGAACTAGNAACRAFMVSNGVVTSLGAAGADSVANGVNNWSQVAGTINVSATARHGFRYSGGEIVDLGTLGGPSSEAFAINDAGHVVGRAQNSAGQWRAFLWRNGTMTDLNSLLPVGSGWLLESASSISEGGQIVGAGTVNGVSRAFLLTPPTNLHLTEGGVRSQVTSNLPSGVEAGRSIRWITSAQAVEDVPVVIYGLRFTHTIEGPAEFTAARGYEDEPCVIETPQRVTCDMPTVDSYGMGREVWLSARTTGSGAITHRATVSSHVPDPNAADNTVTESNRAVSISTLALTPSTIPGGKTSSARVTLTDWPPGGDALVRLSSSRPDIAPVPSIFNMPSHGTNTRAFNITPAVVSAPTTVVITASYGLVTRQQVLTVVPPALQQLYLTPTTVIGGCGTSAGRIALTGSAPPAGAVVTLTNTNSRANVPSTVTVPGGASTTTFTVSTSAVTASTDGQVTASFGGISQTLRLTVRPIRASAIALSPNPVAGGQPVAGTVTLECPAAPGNVTVLLSSGNGAVASPTVSTVVIPAGSRSASFSVRTSPVTATSTVNIYATVFGVRKSASLTVGP